MTARRRSRWWLVPLLLLLLIAGGVAAAVAATSNSPSPVKRAARKPVTVVRTVTQPGTTIQQTVTAPAPPAATVTSPPSQPQPTTSPTANATGSDLNAQGYAKMRAGDYQGALPLLEQAVQQLTGTGTIDEAYADYNLAYTRYALGQCGGVLPLLAHSQSIQGTRTEIDTLRRDAQKACD